MMRYFMGAMGIIIAITLLLGIIAKSAQADGTDPAATEAQQANGAPLVCLALVGGTALLAGGAWLGMLRRTHS